MRNSHLNNMSSFFERETSILTVHKRITHYILQQDFNVVEKT